MQLNFIEYLMLQLISEYEFRNAPELGFFTSII
jgi:hypothetical protein